MKTKIRRMLALLLMGLLLCSTSFAKTWTEFLEGTEWQLQNPIPVNKSMVFKFTGNIVVSNSIYLSTGKQLQESGTYEVFGSGDNLIMKTILNGVSNTYRLGYVNENKITLTETRELVFARFGSLEDTWFKTLMAQQFGSVPAPTPQKCWCCNGTGQCNICFGKGTLPYSPYNRCTYCGGSRICKHCDGTGIFKH